MRPLFLIIAFCVNLWSAELTTKDEFLSFVVEEAVNSYLTNKGLGRAENLSVDTRSKSFSLTLRLQGEEHPLSLKAATYALESTERVNPCTKLPEGKRETFLVVRGISSDREWLNAAAKNYFAEIRLPIPEAYTLPLELFF